MDRRDFLKGAVAVAAVATTPMAATAATAETFDKPLYRVCHEVFEPKTADELVEQMRRWRAGELDRHDVVMAVWRDRALKTHPQVENSQQMRRMQKWWHRHGPDHYIPKDYNGNPMWGTPEETGATLADQYKAWVSVGFPA